jgi:hypothetical protein
MAKTTLWTDESRGQDAAREQAHLAQEAADVCKQARDHVRECILRQEREPAGEWALVAASSARACAVHAKNVRYALPNSYESNQAALLERACQQYSHDVLVALGAIGGES